jgi:orotate phosphoribosyltransferase
MIAVADYTKGAEGFSYNYYEDLTPADAVAVVEDVVTTGASTLKALERARAEGLAPTHAFALVDRMEGGREAVEAAGFHLVSLFTRKDFIP